jgi:hypothetical protein
VTAVAGAAIDESALDDLQLVLTRLRGQDLSEDSPDHLAGDVVELRRLVDGLEVEWTRRVAHLDQFGRSVLDVYPSMTSFLKDRCHMAGSRAQRAVALSHRLAGLPFVVKAFEADDLSLDQVQVFGRIPPHLSDELTVAEVMLVNAATPLTVADTGRLLEYWKTAVDGPGTETTAEQLEDRRYLFCAKTFEGICGEMLIMSNIGPTGAPRPSPTSNSSAATTTPRPTAPPDHHPADSEARLTWSHYWRVRTRFPERCGQRCRVLARGSMNTILIEFEDGHQVATSRNYVRRFRSNPLALPSAVAPQQGVDQSDGEVMVEFATEDESEIDRSYEKLGSDRNI